MKHIDRDWWGIRKNWFWYRQSPGINIISGLVRAGHVAQTGNPSVLGDLGRILFISRLAQTTR